MRGSNPRITTGLAALVPLDRLTADAAAAKAFGPSDWVDRFVGALLCFSNSLAGRADVQHASAIGEDVSVLRHCAGVENLDTFHLTRVIEPLDARTLCIVAGVTLRGHHHRQRGFVKPAQIEIF